MDRFDIELMEMLGMNEEQYRVMEEAVCEEIGEELEDEYLFDYSSNCHCDAFGFCGGTSCPQYWQCHSK